MRGLFRFGQCTPLPLRDRFVFLLHWSQPLLWLSGGLLVRVVKTSIGRASDFTRDFGMSNLIGIAVLLECLSSEADVGKIEIGTSH